MGRFILKLADKSGCCVEIHGYLIWYFGINTIRNKCFIFTNKFPTYSFKIVFNNSLSQCGISNQIIQVVCWFNFIIILIETISFGFF